ncbi:MAG: hypothetical protein H0X38_13535 [Planctomycetes bacterium]|nr:hypothetical protein [Planctomycetota bacterium]
MTRRKRWIIAVVVLLGLPLALAGAVWWALATNQLGRLIEHGFHDRLHGYARIGQVEFVSSTEVVVHGVTISQERGGPAAAIVDRVVVSGPVLTGHIDTLTLESVHLLLNARNLRFLHGLILTENSYPAAPPYRPLRLVISGEAQIDGRPRLTGIRADIAALGPAVSGTATCQLNGNALEVAIATDTVAGERFYRIGLPKGLIEVRPLCDDLAALGLVKRVADDSWPWIPPLVDVGGSVVVADNPAQHFTGDLKLAWNGGGATAALILDRERLKLDRIHLKDEAMGRLDGSLAINLVENLVDVTASSWHPGPRIALPTRIPVDAILAVMPQATMHLAPLPSGWSIKAELSGTGQATITWKPDTPLLVEGKVVPLSLLQPFLPGEVNLAAGRALTLRVVVDDDIREFIAEVEQMRVLYRGWAFGTVDGKVTLRPKGADWESEALLTGVGTLRWAGNGAQSTLAVDLPAVEALLVRLKGPTSLPDLRGGLVFSTTLHPDGEVFGGTLTAAKLTGLELPDMLRQFDADTHGEWTWRSNRLSTHLLGQVHRGELRLPNTWLALAPRRPIFNATLEIAGGVLRSEEILVRATDEQGEPLPDGYSAGLRGYFSATDLRGAVKGVIDHCDLAWSSTLMPIPDGKVHGECAVTFTAALEKDGIASIEGFFLPLDADFTLGANLRASGIKGTVKFALERPKP